MCFNWAFNCDGIDKNDYKQSVIIISELERGTIKDNIIVVREKFCHKLWPIIDSNNRNKRWDETNRLYLFGWLDHLMVMQCDGIRIQAETVDVPFILVHRASHIIGTILFSSVHCPLGSQTSFHD